MSLRERLEQDLPQSVAWRPDNGDSKILVGKITGFGTNTGFDGEPYLIVNVLDDSGKLWAVHAFHYVLVQEIRKYKLKAGTEIGFRFLGKPEGKNYWAYRVESDAEIVMPGETDPDYTPADQPPVSSEPMRSGQSDVTDDDIPF